MSAFPERAWWGGYRDVLLADDEFREAATYFPVRLEFRHDGGSTTLEVRDGVVVSVTDGPHPLGTDITLSAPDAEWQRVLAGETDFFRGTSPGLGEIEVSGDAVGAMRNVKALDRAVLAMSRVGRPVTALPEPSPAPRPSGREVVGRYVDVDGLRTYIEEAGDGPTTIVCFHAACQDTMMYRHAVAGLSDEFRVISVDAPSHGKTAEPEGGEFRSLTRHCEFNERLMETLGLERPVIVGCSMGGNLVLELGSRRPEAYAAIVSCEGADYTPTVSQHLLDMLLLNGQQILECWSQSLTGNRTPPDRAREVVWQIRRCNPEVMAGDLTGYAGFDKRDAVGDIRSPVLLLRGDADWLVSQEQVEATAARIPGSQVAVLAGTGHYPMIENPYEFNEALRDFIRGALDGGVSTS
jgi:pimeloyl-ACP methyl ester carboxylesterase/putative sterol carrier protein